MSKRKLLIIVLAGAILVLIGACSKEAPSDPGEAPTPQQEGAGIVPAPGMPVQVLDLKFRSATYVCGHSVGPGSVCSAPGLEDRVISCNKVEYQFSLKNTEQRQVEADLTVNFYDPEGFVFHRARKKRIAVPSGGTVVVTGDTSERNDDQGRRKNRRPEPPGLDGKFSAGNVKDLKVQIDRIE